MGAAWRIEKMQYVSTAFIGQGARLFGGRWNSPGTAVVYLSENLSLAALEIMVHTRPIPQKDVRLLFHIQWDDSLVEELESPDLPRGWRAEPPGSASMRVGDLWVREQRSAVLAVPSAIVPQERNFLLNPGHPDFAKVRIEERGEFTFDPRLVSR